MHAMQQGHSARLAMLAGAAAMGTALIGGPAEAAETAAPVPAQAKRGRLTALAKKAYRDFRRIL